MFYEEKFVCPAATIWKRIQLEKPVTVFEALQN
jgi:hypothetical protein